MDLEKMNNSIDEMEEIVTKMTSIKDSYEKLGECAAKLEEAKKATKQQIYDFDIATATLKKAYKDMCAKNEQISQETMRNVKAMTDELSIVQQRLREDINELHKKIVQTATVTEEKLKNTMNEGFKKLKTSSSDILLLVLVTLGISLFNLLMIVGLR